MQTPPAVSQMATPRTAGLAIASLVLGILSVTCLSVLAGIPALILGIMAILKIGKTPATLSGKGLAIAGTIMGGVSFALLPIMAALFLPAFMGARTSAVQAVCMSNVKQCTTACLLYAQENNNTLPKNWDEAKEFLGGESVTKQTLHCRAEPGVVCSYELVLPGKRLDANQPPNTTIIVREIKANHRGKRVVGYADGHVELQGGP
jgi:prepilin-type processing-associated H-X9-DG protein